MVWESSGGLGGNSTGEEQLHRKPPLGAEFGPGGAKQMVGCGTEVACGGL